MLRGCANKTESGALVGAGGGGLVGGLVGGWEGAAIGARARAIGGAAATPPAQTPPSKLHTANSTQQPIIFKRSNGQNPIAFFSPCLVIVFSPSHTNRPDVVLAKDIWKMYETCLVLPAEVEFSKIFAEIVKYGRSTGV